MHGTIAGREDLRGSVRRTRRSCPHPAGQQRHGRGAGRWHTWAGQEDPGGGRRGVAGRRTRTQRRAGWRDQPVAVLDAGADDRARPVPRRRLPKAVSMLRIAVPNKGALSEPATEILAEAGYRRRTDPKDPTVVDPINQVE